MNEGALEILYRALDSALGVVVSTNDPERARARLYAARKEACNPAFEDLSIVPSRVPGSTDLWVVRKTF